MKKKSNNKDTAISANRNRRQIINDNQIFIHRKAKTGKNKRFDLNPDHSIASNIQSLNTVPIFWPFVRRI